ncbi:MAG: hypothetical protein E6G95_13415 [Alphaproteobacteria bacterium]|nr:MAG: hypothetical protein E6G95_13415 [Alphaproteobacteria bacterium]
MKLAMSCLVAAATLLAGCYKVDPLEGTQAEPITVEGRKFTVRVGSTGVPNQYRLLVQRSTMVINPDYELEAERAREVARRIMERTCKGRPYSQAVEGMEGVNYKSVFSCLQT